MNILVACEESQAVTIELRRLGHNAFSCDIESCSGGHSEWHIQQDVLSLLNGGCVFTTANGLLQSCVLYDCWDIIIAFPPCTYLSNAGNRWLFKGGALNEERYQKGLAAKDFFLRFLRADCPRIAVENPIHARIYEMPRPSQKIQPYAFGHCVSKCTQLWLKGLPLLMATDLVVPERCFLPSSKSGESGLAARDSKARSKTFPGIARAMAQQWAGIL